jgi:hypothetical protein
LKSFEGGVIIKLYELGRYNIPEKIIDAWIDQIGEELLPVQERGKA